MPKDKEFSHEKQIGKKVLELRQAKGLSRQQLADKIGVSHQQVKKYEDGDNRISSSRLKKICQALEVSFATILGPVEEDGSRFARDTIEIARNFSKIRSPQLRTSILSHVRTIANLGEKTS